MPLLVPTSAGTNLPGWIRAVADTVNGLVRKRLVETTITAATTLTDDYDVYLCDATDAAFTVTLPKAGLYSGKLYYLKKIDSSANAITIDADGSETIDGAATQSIDNQYQTITLFSDGTGWNVVPISPTLGTVSVSNALTFAASGGAAAGTTFDGSGAVTVDYSTVGAQVAGTYLTGNQTITFSGDATGSGTTAVALTLANTGVSAGSYTNASVTVDAKGRVTAASSGASSTSALVLISEQTPSGTGAVTFSSIPATYRDLIVIVRGRGTTAATAVNVGLTFNNDTGANYDKERVSGSNNSTASAAGSVAQSNIDLGQIAALNATADVADVTLAEVFDYRGTTFQKAVQTRNTTKTGTANTNLVVTLQSGWWRSTAAITRLDITLGAGNFVAGSVVSLYGRF